MPATPLLPFMTTQSRWLWPDPQYKLLNLSAKREWENRSFKNKSFKKFKKYLLHFWLTSPQTPSHSDPMPCTCWSYQFLCVPWFQDMAVCEMAMLNVSLCVCTGTVPCDRLPPSRIKLWIHCDPENVLKLNTFLFVFTTGLTQSLSTLCKLTLFLIVLLKGLNETILFSKWLELCQF